VTVLTMLVKQSAPTPTELWRYQWNITVRYRRTPDQPPDAALVKHLSLADPDELAKFILHTSYDPRVVSYHYERRAALDTSAAPKACPGCGTAYDRVSPQQRWQDCSCGGHIVYQCTKCGHEQLYPDQQLYPDLTVTCV
jgi:hypothetical protein